MPATPAASFIRPIAFAFQLVAVGASWIACSGPAPMVAEQDRTPMPRCLEGLHVGLTQDEVKRLRPDTFRDTGGWEKLLEVNIDCGLFNRVDYDFVPMISLLGPRRLVHFALRRQANDEAIESHRARFLATAIGKWGTDFDRLVATEDALRDLPILRWRKRDVTILAIYVPSSDRAGQSTRFLAPPVGREYSYQIVVVGASASERDYIRPLARADEVSGASHLFTDVDEALVSPPLRDEDRLF